MTREKRELRRAKEVSTGPRLVIPTKKKREKGMTRKIFRMVITEVNFRSDMEKVE